MSFLEKEFLQYVLSGLSVGGIYAVTALGYIIIYNVTGIINFAQGDFIMLGGMMMITLSRTGIPTAISFVLSVMSVTLIGMALERFALRYARNASIVSLIIITIAASIFFEGIACIIWGQDPLPLPPFSTDRPISVAGATIVPQALWVIGASLGVVILLSAFFNRTMTGKALRACAVNPFAARLMGINTARMATVSFALSGAVGAAVGITMAPITMVFHDMGITLGLKGFVVAIFGGLNSIVGTVVGGFLLGIVESLGAGVISSGYKDAIAFLVLLVILFFKPSGVMGKKDTIKGGL